MNAPVRSLVIAGVSALAVVAAAASLPAEAKAKSFKPFFMLKLPGEPKGATAMKATTSGPQGQATGFYYDDLAGSLTLNGTGGKAGLTTTILLMNVNVFGGMDLTNVTFPVTRQALVVLSYSKTTINLGNPGNPKIVAYNYSSDQATGTTVTVESYDPVKGEMTGTLSGVVEYHENAQDPNDDARDGKKVTLNNAKFALKALSTKPTAK